MTAEELMVSKVDRSTFKTLRNSAWRYERGTPKKSVLATLISVSVFRKRLEPHILMLDCGGRELWVGCLSLCVLHAGCRPHEITKGTEGCVRAAVSITTGTDYAANGMTGIFIFARGPYEKGK